MGGHEADILLYDDVHVAEPRKRRWSSKQHIPRHLRKKKEG